MASRLTPLLDYPARSDPKARGTMVGRILVAASMTATSLGGCGPAVDPKTVDAAVDQGDLDGTVDQVSSEASTLDQAVQDAPIDHAVADPEAGR